MKQVFKNRTGDLGRSQRHLWSWCFLFGFALLLLNGIGCSHVAEEKQSPAPIQVKRETTQGEVQLTAALDRQTAQVADPIRLRITARTPEGFSVQFPEAGKKLGAFQVVTVQDQFDVPLGEQRIWQRDYKLESLNSGEKTIPPIKLSYVDRSGAKTVRGTVNSDPIQVDIVSLLEGQADPTKFRDIKGLVEISPENAAKSSWWTYGFSAGGIVLLASFLLLVWYRRQKSCTPTQWALLQLAQLEQRNLLEQGNTEPFYCQLTDIIRHYIERQFGYRAPRQTTTEFLSAMQCENLLCAQHRASLQGFLQVADMVKFARHQPSRHEANEAIGKAREFVFETVDVANDAKEQVAA